MLDLKSHILFPNDPTPKKLMETLQLAQAASNAGFTSLIATPIYSYDKDAENTYEYNKKKCEYINSFLKENNLDIKVYLGSEINYSHEIIDLLKNSQITTINDTRYILINFNIECDFYNMIDSIFQLQVAGFTTIISGIEKYKYVTENYNIVKDLIRRDILLQLDVLSVIGSNGEKVKKTAKELLKHNMIHSIGTNASRPDHYNEAKPAIHKINKIIGDTNFKEITTTNGEHILKNAVIYPSIPKETKKRLFRK